MDKYLVGLEVEISEWLDEDTQRECAKLKGNVIM